MLKLNIESDKIEQNIESTIQSYSEAFTTLSISIIMFDIDLARNQIEDDGAKLLVILSIGIIHCDISICCDSIWG